MRSSPILKVSNHDRTAVGLTYVYPVVSRRAGGVSIGINLNTNNACNWRCIYCQVPDLRRGAAPPVDLLKLRAELTGFLHEVLDGDFMQRSVPKGARRLNDIALSGNGEPTSSVDFLSVVKLIGELRASKVIPVGVKTILITNGSLVHRKGILDGIERLRSMNGEVWFKLDSATPEGMQSINDAGIGVARVEGNLGMVARACPTWVQTCVLALDGDGPSAIEQQAYLDFLRRQIDAGVPLAGVLLYGLARASFQPEAARLSALPASWLEAYANRIRSTGITVKVTV